MSSMLSQCKRLYTRRTILSELLLWTPRSAAIGIDTAIDGYTDPPDALSLFPRIPSTRRDESEHACQMTNIGSDNLY